jgi:alpha-tubulin suppressor-like RCC1 family protein
MKYVWLLFLLISCNVAKQPPAGITGAGSTTGGTILNPKTKLSFSTYTYSVSESDGIAAISLTLSAPAPAAFNATYIVTGNATSGTDFTALAGTIPFALGDSTATIFITLTDDVIYDPNEKIVLTLTGVDDTTNFELGTLAQTQISIIDNEAVPELNFALASQAAVAETVGTVTVNYTLTLASAQAITANISFGGNAGYATDYAIASTILTIPAGTTAGSFNITITDDAFNEGTENIQIVLDTPQGATIGVMNSHTFQITDNEAPAPPTVQFSIASGTVAEGAGTYSTVAIAITGTLETPQTVRYVLNSPTSTAKNGFDFSASSSVTVTIPAGVANYSTNISIPIVNDSIFELDEVVNFSLVSTSLLAVSGNSTFSLTITDNDVAPTIAFLSPSSTPIESSTAHLIQLQLSAVSGADATVSIAATPNTAIADDYILPVSTVTIPAGSTSVFVPVFIVNDNLDEPTENFDIDISAPVNASLGAQTNHDITITDVDVAPTVALRFGFNDVAANDDTGNFTLRSLVSEFLDLNDNQTVDAGDDIALTNVKHLRIALSAASGNAITVPITFSGTASGDVDDDAVCDNNVDDFFISTNADVTTTYSAGIYSASVVIPAGRTYYELEVNVCNDNWFDPNESIIATMGTPTNANLSATFSSTVEIEDQEGAPTVSFQSAAQSVTEDTIGTTNLTATLSGLSQTAVTVPFTITGSATSLTDYSVASNLISISPGTLTGSTTVTLTDDLIFEGNETIIFTMTNSVSGAVPSGATIHTFTITDDEVATDIQLSLMNDFTVLENIGLVTGTVTTTGGVLCSSPLVFTFNPIAGTAVQGADHDLYTPQISFPALATSASFGFNIVDDTLRETTGGASIAETIIISIPAGGVTCNGQAITLTDATSVVSITDNEPIPTITFQQASTTVGEGAGTVTINISSNYASVETLTFNSVINQVTVPSIGYDNAQWDNTSGERDFTNPVPGVYSDALSIPVGQTTTSYNLTIIDDSAYELDEKIFLTLSTNGSTVQSSSPSNSMIVTIDENDLPPYIHLSYNSATTTIVNSNSAAESASTPSLHAVLKDTAFLTGGSLVTSSRIPITVDVYPGGTMSVDQDFDFGSYPTLNFQTITIAPGASSNSSTITLYEDSLYESDEILTFTNGGTNALIGNGVVTITRTNDDNMPQAVLIATKGRGFSENQGAVEFTVQYQNTGKDSTITYTVCEDSLNGCNPSTATGELDHTLSTGTIQITGSTTQTAIDNDSNGINDINSNIVTFSIVDDAIAESEETIVVRISSSDFDFDSLATTTPTNNYDIHTFYIFPSDRIQMALGDNFGCALSDEKVKCWGQNELLGLGINSSTGGGYFGTATGETISNQTFVDLGSNFTPIKIAAGSSHICALSSNGYVKCWGNNRYGKTGNGIGGASSYTGDASNEMGDYLTSIPIGEQVQDIALGNEHSCALTISGQVKCWGLNNETAADDGPLGYNSTTTQTCLGNEDEDNCKGDYPGEIAALDFISLGSNKTAYKIAASEGQACALVYDSSTFETYVNCFGDGISGVQRLSNLAEVASPVDSTIEYLEVKNLVGSPFGRMCAVYTNESTDDLQCWDSDVTTIVDITPNLSTVSALSIADNNVLCIYDPVTHPLKTARCGTINLNTTIYSDAQASVTYDFFETYLGQDFACAATGASSLACWGENSNGQLAVGSSVDNGTILNPNSAIDFQSF